MATPLSFVVVHDPANQKDSSTSQLKVPAVFTVSLRPDLVRVVHSLLEKNKRQAYGVAANAGYQTSAVSWGTGRAVSRIPRVRGAGTHRTSQGAFGNMCRGGGMFNPNKVWRRWHRHVNLKEKRHAVASAIASTGVPSLVMARGHKIDDVPELPLVVNDTIQQVSKTSEAIKVLKSLGCNKDVEKCKNSKSIKCGRGKSRNRRYSIKKGPLIIYSEKSAPIVKAFRNIPGVDLCHIDKLNLLTLAPGGTMGRLVIWSKSAFQKLQTIYGSVHGTSFTSSKKGYHLMRPIMTNPDLSRIINSDEIQSYLQPKKEGGKHTTQKKNPLKNINAMMKLNPAAKQMKAIAKAKQTKGTPEYEAVQKAKAELKAKKTAHKMINKSA